jgi:hypothetical protein
VVVKPFDDHSLAISPMGEAPPKDTTDFSCRPDATSKDKTGQRGRLFPEP